MNSFQATYQKHILKFKFDAKTSRGVYHEHTVYFLKIWNVNNPEIFGLGEAAPLKGLSIDDRPDFEKVLENICSNINHFNAEILSDFPSIQFALETAWADLENGGKRMIFNTDFYHSQYKIPINGLVWMGDKQTMLHELRNKINESFSTVKLKVGGINFEDEIEILKNIRKEFSPRDITIRLDANGAFSQKDAFEKIKVLSDFAIHSIEQPISQGQLEAMTELCSKSPIPIALDEELIGKMTQEQKWEMLYFIKPQYIILKPTLLGGFSASDEWIMLAENLNIGWWVTSALESNIGLNAIAQFTSKHEITIPQGLGTGSLYENNVESPLIVKCGFLEYQKGFNFIF
jgi:o-succinylbenzoate synthase